MKLENGGEKEGWRLENRPKIQIHGDLVGAQGSQRLNKDNNAKHICRYCHRHFCSRKVDKHLEEVCMVNEGQQIELAETASCIEFDKFIAKLECPFVKQGDFECLTLTLEDG